MEDKKVLRMRHKCLDYLDVEVEPDKCNMLDIYIELLQGAAKKEFCFPNHPSLWYMHESKSHKLERDTHLLEMFSLLSEKKVINIAIGSTETSCENLQLAKGLIDYRVSSVDANLPSSQHIVPSMGYMDETQPAPSQIVSYEPTSNSQPPFAILFNQLNHGTTIPPLQPNHVSFGLQEKRIPATSARRKGVYIPKGKNTSSSSQPNSGNLSRTRGRTYKSGLMEDDVDDVDSEDDIYNPSESSSSTDEDENTMNDLVDEDDALLAYIDDGYDPDNSNQWKEDKDAYFDRLYANGELYADKQFGNIVIRQWMIFFDKEHLSRILRNYCIQEGVNIITLKSDMRRLTATCASAGCNWRIHASRLSDGYTWAIKSLTDTHSCTRLSTHNPMASTSWAAEKLMDDIKANPIIKGKTINELLLKRYGVELKKTATYDTRDQALATIDGSHDSSYAKLPAYCEVLKSTNPSSKAHVAWKVVEENPEKPIHFKNIFISFRPMIEGFRGCRGLIALDGCHLKGKFGGVLIAATTVDANTELFPLAYGVYENESKDTWSSFIYHLKDALKGDVRDNLTIISDRQKGIEPALDDIWPTVSRRYCCRHLCANFKKTYPGIMMHNLFWGCCDSYSAFTYEKAIDAIRVIRHIRTQTPVETYVSSWFSVQAYRMAYSVDFHSIGDEEQWPKFDFPNIEPPIMKRGVGRPARNRRREEGEKQKGKRSNTVRCGKCKAFGHNAKTCKGGPTLRELKEQGARVEQRQTKKRKVQAKGSQQWPTEDDAMGSAPWVDGSQRV